MRPFRLLPLLLLFALIGCASTPAGDEARPRRQADLISSEEIQGARFNNAYDLVQALRPNWIRGRGAQSINDPTAGVPVVYMDGSRLGAPDQLRQISPTDIESIRFLNATEAQARYGLGHTGGAIVIAMRRR
jgi:hypothetical protein